MHVVHHAGCHRLAAHDRHGPAVCLRPADRHTCPHPCLWNQLDPLLDPFPHLGSHLWLGRLFYPCYRYDSADARPHDADDDDRGSGCSSSSSSCSCSGRRDPCPRGDPRCNRCPCRRRDASASRGGSDRRAAQRDGLSGREEA